MPEDKDQQINPVEWGRLIQAVENLHEDVRDTNKNVKDGFSTLNNRVRKVEIKQGWLWGGLSVVGVAIPLLFKYVL